MRKVLHKLIRFNRAGINAVADVNAVVSTGERGVTSSSVRSHNRIVQRNGQTWTESTTEDLNEKEVDHDG